MFRQRRIESNSPAHACPIAKTIANPKMIALIVEALAAATAIPLRFKRIKAPHCLCDGDRRNAVTAVPDRRLSAVAAVADLRQLLLEDEEEAEEQG
jgi:hypothetical protein